MPTSYFTPPTAPLVPAAVNPSHPGFTLFRHYRPWDAGLNLWVVDGEVTTTEPDYATVTPEHTFLGGHIYEVDDEIATLLVGAGYELLGGYAPPAPGVPLPGTPDPEEPHDLPPSYGLASHFDLDALFDTARYA